jgi:hypothetical protein
MNDAQRRTPFGLFRADDLDYRQVFMTLSHPWILHPGFGVDFQTIILIGG